MSSESDPNDSARDGDLVSQIVGLIESLVSLIRDRAISPIVKIARAIVFGTLAAVVGFAVLVLFAILVVRVLVVAIPGERAWLAHLITGVLFLTAGVFAMSKRRAPTVKAS